ncbi:MAG: peptidoglycan-binding protein [Alphaproteobacteria bacterium]|nr:peptidoglycan-binding protein [Alphaproteobacteria bacterium]
MPFQNMIGFLSAPVGNNLKNNKEDVRATKRGLNALGFFEEEEENGIITRDLDAGIKNFQRENNLRVDGRILPGGETESALTSALVEKEREETSRDTFITTSKGLRINPEKIVQKLEDREDKKQTASCQTQEIEWINAQGAYQVAQDNLKQAQTNLKNLKRYHTELNKAFKKEKSFISGDRGKARNIGAAIGTIIGGAAAGLPGAATGIGAGGSIGIVVEEGLDFLTGKKTDGEYRNEIRKVESQIQQIEGQIQDDLKPKLQKAAKIVEQKKSIYLNCKNRLIK